MTRESILQTFFPNREVLSHPFEDVLNKVMNEVCSNSNLHSIKRLGKSGYPKTDVLVVDDQYIIEMAIPGVNPNDLTVDIIPHEELGKVLKVTGKMERDYKYSKSKDYHYKELKRSYFERSFILPEFIKEDPDATVKNGMLTLIWDHPPSEQKETQIRSIEVKSE